MLSTNEFYRNSNGCEQNKILQPAQRKASTAQTTVSGKKGVFTLVLKRTDKQSATQSPTTFKVLPSSGFRPLATRLPRNDTQSSTAGYNTMRILSKVNSPKLSLIVHSS